MTAAPSSPRSPISSAPPDGRLPRCASSAGGLTTSSAASRCPANSGADQLQPITHAQHHRHLPPRAPELLCHAARLRVHRHLSRHGRGACLLPWPFLLSRDGRSAAVLYHPI